MMQLDSRLGRNVRNGSGGTRRAAAASVASALVILSGCGGGEPAQEEVVPSVRVFEVGKRAGIAESLLRVSAGIEAPGDLVDDLRRGLDRAGGTSR